jgi:cytochrome c nitrite reductase small subunit
MKLPLIVGIVAILAVIGTGLYASDFTAYLGNDPATCNNCHVMDDVYENWGHSAHRAWAACGDCHTPHALIPKYLVKAASGFRHVSAFLLGDIPDAIRPRLSSIKIIQDNCIRCHADTVADILNGAMPFDRYCFDCHRDTAHGERGVSISPYPDKEVYHR